MRIAGSGLEAGAHARFHVHLPAIGHKRGSPFQDEDELVLLRVGVTKGRHRARFERREIDPKYGQSKEIAQRPLYAFADSHGEDVGRVALSSSGRRFTCGKRDRIDHGQYGVPSLCTKTRLVPSGLLIVTRSSSG